MCQQQLTRGWGIACRSYPDAFVMRCFAFQPSDALVQAGHAEMPNLMLFPPTESGTCFRNMLLLQRTAK